LLREESRLDDSTLVLRWVKRWNDSLFLKDLIKVRGIDTWNAALSTELEWNTIGRNLWVSVSNIDAQGTVIEL
jgi:hypothetical protein